MGFLDIFMLICATWYVSFIATKMKGPFGIFADMRARPIFKVMKCIYCFSIWAGLYLYILLYFGYPEPVYVFGIAGGAHLLASFTGANYGTPD